MGMKDLMTKAVKLAAIWFAAGALFAVGANFAAPLLTPEIGALASAVNPIWLGALLAGTSTIATFMDPIVSFIMGESKDSNTAVAEGKNEPAKQVNITVVQSPQQSQEQVVVTANHRQTIEAQRLELAAADKSITQA